MKDAYFRLFESSEKKGDEESLVKYVS